MSSQQSKNEETIRRVTKIARKKERGALFPQIMLTFTMCIGAFLFGHILNWGQAAWEHMDFLTYCEETSQAENYAWLTCGGPLGIALGIVVWEFLLRKIGPRNTLLCQTPLLLISWFLMAYFTKYTIYLSAHCIAAFCAGCYLYAGEVYLTECVHRNNIKILFAFFRSSILLGIMSVNIFTAFFDKIWICIICAVTAVVCFAFTITLPDSPLYLIRKSALDAETSLQYYLGKDKVGPELNIVRQQMNFLSSNKPMLSSKVVLKAIGIITVLQFFKICTGYYAFILDSVRIFDATNPDTSYRNNIIWGIVLFVTQFIGCFVHLYGNFGVKKPMLISMFLCSIMLGTLGTLEFLRRKGYYVPMADSVLIIFCTFAISYGIGMNICPEILLFSYIPGQIYDFLKKMMTVGQWILTFAVVRLYMEFQMKLGLCITMWILTAITMIGFIFIAVFIVDTKGKSLMNIQIELGGNPVGNRGSKRQRLANPFEPLKDMYFLEKLIAADLAATRINLSSNSI